MGNYRQHLGFSTFLGVGFAWFAYVLAGIHWLHGSVAALLATLSGLLPDLDSPSGVGLRGFTGVLGVLTALAVWQRLGDVQPPPAFELHLWAVLLAYVAVRHGLRRVLSRITVHRGMGHSLPACAIWGAITYLHYPSPDPILRGFMATAVMVGFLSHLFLDEFCSVDLQGARVNKAFGTALKLWSSSPWSTLATYAVLGYLTKLVIDDWPDDLTQYRPPTPPRLPAWFDEVRQWIAGLKTPGT